MIAGTIVLEDVSLSFTINAGLMAYWTVCDSFTGKVESHSAPQDKFLKALAIAMHNDGMPDYVKDYPDAESIMGEIRWIP